jgi:hypothetical protein
MRGMSTRGLDDLSPGFDRLSQHVVLPFPFHFAKHTIQQVNVEVELCLAL